MKDKKQFMLLTILMTIFTISANLAHAVTPEKNYDLGFVTFQFSMMFLFMSLGQLVGSNVWGYLSDHFGRKKYLVISPIVYSVCQIIFGYATNLYLILLVRFIAGMFSVCMFVVSLAYIIDITTIEKRSKYVSIYSSITALGTTFGYFLGGLVGKDNYHYTFILQSVILLVLALAMQVFLKEPLKHKVSKKQINFIASFRSINNKRIYIVFLISLFAGAAMTMYNSSSQQFMKLSLSFSPLYIGIYMAISGVFGMLMNLLIYPFLRQKLSDDFIIKMVYLALFLFSLIIINHLGNYNYLFYIMLIQFMLLNSLYVPLTQSLVSTYAKKNNGVIMGLNQSFTALGNVFASLYVAFFFDKNNYVVFYTLSILFLLDFGLLIYTTKTKRKIQESITYLK